MQALTARAELDARPADGRLALALGLVAAAVSFVIFAATSSGFDAGRPDFFYLADAFLHGRLWLDHPLGPADNVIIDGRVYVPFAPFPAVAFVPLAALFGPVRLDQWEQVIDSAIAAVDVGRAGGSWAGSASGRSSIASGSWPCSASAPRSGGSTPVEACGTPGT